VVHLLASKNQIEPFYFDKCFLCVFLSQTVHKCCVEDFRYFFCRDILKSYSYKLRTIIKKIEIFWKMIGMWIIGLLVVACCLHPLVLGFFFSIISSIALAKWGVSVAISRVGPLRMDGVHIVIKSATETKTLKVDTISVATRISSFLMSWFEEHPFRIEILKPTMDIVKQVSNKTYPMS